MRLLFVWFFCFFLGHASAQAPIFDLTNPRGAIRTHLDNLQPDNYNDSLAALPFVSSTTNLHEAKQYAVKLKRILDGKGIYIYTNEISRNANHLDSTSRKHKYILTPQFEEIYLKKDIDGNWGFSSSSLRAIDDLYATTFRFGSGKLLSLLPKLGTKKYLGLYTYQYLAILILAFLSTIIYLLFSFFTERIFTKVLKSSGYAVGTTDKYLWMIARPTSVFIIILLLMLFVPALQLPIELAKYVTIILGVMVPLFGTIIMYRIVNIVSILLARMAQKTESSLDDQLVPLLRKTLKTFVIIVGTLFILDNLNVPILPLLTGLSIGGLAFALAAQDTIKNFFGSVMIFIDKPFQVGDWITSDGVDGTVEEVGFRSSRIRTFRNSLIYVPNGKLADNTIDNHGLRSYRRFFTQIAINYDTPPALIELFIIGLRKIVESHPHTWKENYHVYFNDMAASSLNIMFYIFFKVPTWGDELRARHEILIEIVKLGKEMGISFAFPTQTLHVENLPGQPSLASEYMSPSEAEIKMNEYLKK